MKSEHAGWLTVDEQFANDGTAAMVEEVARLLRESYESPFVAIQITPAGSSRSSYVIHDGEIGQYRFIQHVNSAHLNEPYWAMTGKQPLQWLVEDILHHYGHDCIEFDVDVIDIQAALETIRHHQHDLRDPDAEKLATIATSDIVRNNRKDAFASTTSTPAFLTELITEPAYSTNSCE